MADPTTQLDALNEINNALDKQLETLNTISLKLGNQAAVTHELASASQEAGKALEEQAESTNMLDVITTKLNDQWKKFTANFTKWMPASFKDSWALLKTNISSIISVITGGQASVQGFFSSIYNFFVEKAAQLAQDMIRFSQALENVRDKFGDLNENTSRQVVSSARALSGGLREASNSSKAFAGKFGIGIDAGIARLEKMSEIAGDLGATFDTLSSDGFEKASTQLYVLKDGLAFTSEGLQATNRLAMISGESLGSFSEHIMASVDKIGKHFGMSTKVLGGDVGKALGNFKMLGKMTGDYVKEITKAAVFTRKLGIELSTLTGLVDKFDDFESGAEAAAQLAQGFGLVVDPLKMMGMEVGPRLAELQKGFIATGRSIDSMTRQERALLASTSGLSDEQVQLAFSQKGLSMSYDDISKGANEAAEKQKSSQEVMVDLAENIKNILHPLLAFDGFVTAFFAGISKGFGSTTGFMKIIGKLADQLIRVYEIGGETGRILADVLFPAGSENNKNSMLSFLTNIGDMWITIAQNVKWFVKSLSSGSNVADTVGNFFTNIFDTINNTFGNATSGFDVVGFSIKFGTKIIEIFTGAVKFFIKQIPKWSASLKTMFSAGSGPASSLASGFFAAFSSLNAELPKLGPIFLEFGGAMVDAIKDFFYKYPFGAAIAGLIVGGGPLANIFSSAGSSVVTAIFEALFGPTTVANGATAAAAAGANAKGAVDAALAKAGADPAAVVGTSAAWLERLFNVIEDPAKIIAMGAAIATVIVAVGTAVNTVLMSFMTAQPPNAKSFFDTIKDAAISLKDVAGADLFAVGAIVGGLFLGIGAIVAAIAMSVGKVDWKVAAMLATGVFFGVQVFNTKEAVTGVLTDALNAIKSFVADLATSFADSVFIANLNTVVMQQTNIEKLSSLAVALGGIMRGVNEISAAAAKDANGNLDVAAISAKVTSSISVLNSTVTALATMPDMTKIADSSTGMLAIKETFRDLKRVVDIIALIAPASTDAAIASIGSLTKPDEGFIAKLGSLIGAIADSSVNYNIGTTVKEQLIAADSAIKSVSSMSKLLSTAADFDVVAAGAKITLLTGGQTAPAAGATPRATGFLSNLSQLMFWINYFSTTFSFGPNVATQFTAAAKAVESVAGIVKALSEIPDVNAVITKIGLLAPPASQTGFFDSLGVLMNYFQDFSTKYSISKKLKANFETVAEAVGSVVGVVKALTEMPDVDLATAAIKLLIGDNGVAISSGFIDTLGILVTSITAMPAVSAGTKDSLTAAASSVASVASIISAIFDVKDKMVGADSTAKTLTGFIPSLKGLSESAVTNFGKMQVLGPNLTKTKADGIGNMFKVIEAYTTGVEKVSEQLGADKLEAFQVRITALKDHVGKVRDILADIGTIDLTGAITDVQKSMKVGKSVMTVNGGAVVVSVNMTVNMNAEKMSAALVMGGYIEAQPEFGNYLLSKDGQEDVFANATNAKRKYIYGPDGVDTTTYTPWVPG